MAKNYLHKRKSVLYFGVNPPSDQQLSCLKIAYPNRVIVTEKVWFQNDQDYLTFLSDRSEKYLLVANKGSKLIPWAADLGNYSVSEITFRSGKVHRDGRVRPRSPKVSSRAVKGRHNGNNRRRRK